MPVVFTDEPAAVEQIGQLEGAGDTEHVPPVLDPEHPLLVRFQQALKAQLVNQITSLKSDVYEMEADIKLKNSECEELGVKAYEAQQLINQQHKDLENRVIQLDEICSATEEIELQLQADKKTLEEKCAQVFEAEKKDLRLRKEVEALNLLIVQMKQWENDIESDLTVNQRVFEKTKKDKVKLAEEKRQLDMLVYRLMSEVWRLEEELETLDMQLRVKEADREKLAEGVIASNIDIESMNTELKCIVKSWNSVVVATSHRDRHYNSIKEELEALTEKLSTMCAECNQLKKMVSKETIQNQRMSEIKERLDTDVENTKIILQVEITKRDNLEIEMSEKQILIDQIDSDLNKLQAQNAAKSNEISLLLKTFEKISQQKMSLEEDILTTLNQHITDNKAANHLNKLLKQAQKENREFMYMWHC